MTDKLKDLLELEIISDLEVTIDELSQLYLQFNLIK